MQGIQAFISTENIVKEVDKVRERKNVAQV
jgi:hypothetical protein